MHIFGKRNKTILTTIPIVVQRPEDPSPVTLTLKMADYRLGEWEELCKNFLIYQARGNPFMANVCNKCGHRTALRLWAERPQECEAEDARRISFRCINDWCNETYSNNGLIRQSDEHEILKIIDPQQFTCIPESPYIPILIGFGDHVQRRERVMLLRGKNDPMFDDPAEVVDFGMYGGAWIEIATGGKKHRVNLGGVTVKRE